MSDLDPLFPIIDGKYKMDQEPIVRIGVVLAEDSKTTLKFKLPAGAFTCEAGALNDADAKELALPANARFEARVIDGEVAVFNSGGEMLETGAAECVRIVPPTDAPPAEPGDGVLVHGVVAGRGFHWLKEIDQTLTGVLEFRVEGDRLVVINELPLEEYMTGVITGEMSGECPIEYMKAQAVSARSWLLGQLRPPHPGAPFNWCNDDCCQRYQGTGGWSERAVEAIKQCRGEVLITASNKYCDARYSKSTGGVSEDAEAVWHEPIEGLESVLDAPEGSDAARFYPVTEENIEEYILGDWTKTTDCFAGPNVTPEDLARCLGRVDESGSYFRWSRTLTQDMLMESLSKRGGIDDLAQVIDIRTGKRGRSGRLVELFVDYLTVGGEEATFIIPDQYDIRAALSMNFLFSSAFIITERRRDDDGNLEAIVLHGAGWGHGAGLCQIGGLGRALAGQTYDQVLLHYFQKVRLEKIYP